MRASYGSYASDNSLVIVYITGLGEYPILEDNCNSLFCALVELRAIEFGDVDTSAVIDMSYMFQVCKKLTSIDLSGFDTSKVIVK